MLQHYTEASNQWIDNLVKTDIAKIWADIYLMGDESDSEKWRAKIEKIAQDYLLSSRFALMRILHNRALSAQTEAVYADQDCFRVRVGQDWITFRDISMDHAKNLSPEEHIAYINYLLEIAGPSPDEYPDLHQEVILRAWHDEDSANAVMIHSLPKEIVENPRQLKKAISRIKKENKKRYKTIISREQAFQIGHVLSFQLEEMQWFLTRVIHAEESGFRMNHSDDIIEAFGYKTNASCIHVAELKMRYQEISAGIEKIDDSNRSQNWTRATGSELLEKIENWKNYPDSMDENFLMWMERKAPGLDIHSHTAMRIYQKLVIYAYTRIKGWKPLPDEAHGIWNDIEYLCNHYEDIQDIEDYLYQDGTVSQEKCECIAEYFYKENQKHTEWGLEDRAEAWSIITTQKDGTVSSAYGVVNDSRTRIQKLLLGEWEVEKGDILLMIYFILNLVWYGSPSIDADTLQYRIYDMKDIAGLVLETALLDSFYPAHLIEQSFMLSIIYGGRTGQDPAVIYANILKSVKEKRNREPGSRKHTLLEKIDIVNQYRNGMTLKQCAQLNEIGEQTLSGWQKKLIEQGYIMSNEENEKKLQELL